MTLSFISLLATLTAVTSRPQADGPPTAKTGHLPRSTAFRSGSQTDIFLNVAINNNKTDLQQNISYEDVEYLIDKSGEEYLDTLLVNKNIEHALDSDIIHEDTRLIVDVHIILYSEVMNEGKYERDVDERNIDININELRSKIQYDSDMKYGRNTVNIQLNHYITNTELLPISTITNVAYVNKTYHASYLWYLVYGSWIIILILICCALVLYFSCFYNTKVEETTVVDSEAQEALDLVIVPSKKEETACVHKDGEEEILVVSTAHEEERMLFRYQTQSYAMSDSEKLYEVHHDHDHRATNGADAATKHALNNSCQ